MAYIQQDDKLQNDQAPNTDYPQAQGINSGGSSMDVGSGSGGAVSTAGVGAGGTGAWTNVQSYLEANKQGTGSAQALEKQVGSQFDQEKGALSQNAQSFLGDAQKQVDDNRIDNAQADNLINQAAGAYSWQGNANDDYNKTVEKVRGALTNQYSGPTTYSYGFSAPTQTYAQGLKDNGGFDSLMNDVYSKTAGQPLSRGQFDLQKQLDVSNQGLADARQRLLERYNGLEGERDSVVADATQKLSGLADQYRSNQNALRDYLGQAANKYDTATAQAEADARSAYNKEYTTGRSGHNNIFFDASSPYTADWMSPRGIWGDQNGRNLTWEQIQREQNMPKLGWSAGGDYPVVLNPLTDRADMLQGRFLDNGSALNDFYSAQDQKYANTADQEKRTYNSILDFLNQSTGKKTQGFKVRG